MTNNTNARGRGARLAPLVAALVSGIALASCSMWRGETVSVPRYFMAYGISTYENASILKYADDDAIAIRDLLVKNGYTKKDFGIDSYATKSQILSSMASLGAIEENATFVFYFSGHGDSNSSTNDEYLSPYDTAFSGVVAVPSTMISTKELADGIAAIPCKNKVVILDACYSGGFVDPGSSIDTAPQDYGVFGGGFAASTVATAFLNFGDLLVANARERGATPPIVLSAAGSEETSSENETCGLGVFTNFLIASAQNGDANGDGYVTTTEAYYYAASHVNSAWNGNNLFSAFLPRISGGARDLVLFERTTE